MRNTDNSVFYDTILRSGINRPIGQQFNNSNQTIIRGSYGLSKNSVPIMSLLQPTYNQCAGYKPPQKSFLQCRPAMLPSSLDEATSFMKWIHPRIQHDLRTTTLQFTDRTEQQMGENRKTLYLTHPTDNGIPHPEYPRMSGYQRSRSPQHYNGSPQHYNGSPQLYNESPQYYKGSPQYYNAPPLTISTLHQSIPSPSYRESSIISTPHSSPYYDDPVGFSCYMLPLPCAYLRLPWPPDKPYIRLMPTNQDLMNRMLSATDTDNKMEYGKTANSNINSPLVETHFLIVKRIFVERIANSPSVYLLRYVYSPSSKHGLSGSERLLTDELHAHRLFLRSQNLFSASNTVGLGFSSSSAFVFHIESKEQSVQINPSDQPDVCVFYFRLKLTDLPFTRQQLECDWSKRRSEIHRSAIAVVVVFDFRFSGLTATTLTSFSSGSVPHSTAEWSPDDMRRIVHLTAQTHSILDSWLINNLEGRELTIIHLPPPGFALVIDKAIGNTQREKTTFPRMMSLEPPSSPTVLIDKERRQMTEEATEVNPQSKNTVGLQSCGFTLIYGEPRTPEKRKEESNDEVPNKKRQRPEDWGLTQATQETQNIVPLVAPSNTKNDKKVESKSPSDRRTKREKQVVGMDNELANPVDVCNIDVTLEKGNVDAQKRLIKQSKSRNRKPSDDTNTRIAAPQRPFIDEIIEKSLPVMQWPPLSAFCGTCTQWQKPETEATNRMECCDWAEKSVVNKLNEEFDLDMTCDEPLSASRILQEALESRQKFREYREGGVLETSETSSESVQSKLEKIEPQKRRGQNYQSSIKEKLKKARDSINELNRTQVNEGGRLSGKQHKLRSGEKGTSEEKCERHSVEKAIPSQGRSQERIEDDKKTRKYRAAARMEGTAGGRRRDEGILDVQKTRKCRATQDVEGIAGGRRSEEEREDVQKTRKCKTTQDVEGIAGGRRSEEGLEDETKTRQCYAPRNMKMEELTRKKGRVKKNKDESGYCEAQRKIGIEEKKNLVKTIKGNSMEIRSQTEHSPFGSSRFKETAMDDEISESRRLGKRIRNDRGISIDGSHESDGVLETTRSSGGSSRNTFSLDSFSPSFDEPRQAKEKPQVFRHTMGCGQTQSYNGAFIEPGLEERPFALTGGFNGIDETDDEDTYSNAATTAKALKRLSFLIKDLSSYIETSFKAPQQPFLPQLNSTARIEDPRSGWLQPATRPSRPSCI